MEANDQPKLTFLGVDFPHIEFNVFQPVKKSADVEIYIEPKLFRPKDIEKRFSIIMSVNVTSQKQFSLSLTAHGHFLIEVDLLTPEEKKNFMSLNATAIMFPYVRAFISTLTSNLGSIIPTLTIPTRFFSGELEEIDLDNKEDEFSNQLTDLGEENNLEHII